MKLEFCLPTRANAVPAAPDWIREIASPVAASGVLGLRQHLVQRADDVQAGVGAGQNHASGMLDDHVPELSRCGVPCRYGDALATIGFGFDNGSPFRGCSI